LPNDSPNFLVKEKEEAEGRQPRWSGGLTNAAVEEAASTEGKTEMKKEMKEEVEMEEEEKVRRKRLGTSCTMTWMS
jgi:hypothetical protein